MAVSSSKTEACILVGLCVAALTVVAQGRIDDHLEVNWGGVSHGSVSPDGQVISLSLDSASGGSSFRSKDAYLYARTDLQMKLAPNNSAGTVTTCFVSSRPWSKPIDQMCGSFGP